MSNGTLTVAPNKSDYFLHWDMQALEKQAINFGQIVKNISPKDSQYFIQRLKPEDMTCKTKD